VAVLDAVPTPIVLAPMAGGPSTPVLTAAVCEAGGLGFAALGYLSPERAAEELRATRALTARPFGANVFMPPGEPADPASYAAWVERVRAGAGGRPVGAPRTGDDAYEEKLALLCAEPVAAVSFTFGCPSREVVARLRAAGTETWVTVTSPQEGSEAVAAGADVLVAQGAEAGGHRGTFVDRVDAPLYGVLALLQLLEPLGPPVVAAGAIATPAAVDAVLAAGAEAAQVGTAFLLCPEAGTAEPHRRAVASAGETALTRAYTGRLARGIRNRFTAEHGADAPLAYPELHFVTAPLRAAARAEGDAEAVNLWAGEAHELAREEPAADVVARLGGPR